MTNEMTLLGIMSGTSLDGLDLALCRFYMKKNTYRYEIIKSDCAEYTEEIKESLRNAPNLNAVELLLFDKYFGQYIATKVLDFTKDIQKPDYIASHGHTIFHNPQEDFTYQIGCGSEIATRTGIPTIYNFRRSDVALGGQGAPLVPCGDKLLFSEYDFCLNIGGFSNISYDTSEERRVAFDICPSNIILNELAQESGISYDDEGKLAASGQTNSQLLESLNKIEYYKIPPPKSLGREYMEEFFLPLIKNKSIPLNDRLHTYTLHIAEQIDRAVKDFPLGRLLITGGGAHNTHLINQIRRISKHTVIVPGKQTIDYKEALIFAFLGYLRAQKKPNVLCSVTGASRDNTAGIICLP